MSVIAVTIVGGAMVAASFTDITRFRVYNALTFPLLGAGLIFGLATGGLGGLGAAMSGAAFGFGVLLLPYLMGGLGAGDVKFVMAVGAWVGADVLLPGILVGGVVVLLYHLVIIARREGAFGLAMGVQVMLMRLMSFGRGFAGPDHLESVQYAARNSGAANRGRLIPFSAMMSIGIAIAGVAQWWIMSR